MERGAHADAVDAGDQLEPPGEIVVLAHGGLQASQLGFMASLQSLDVALDLLEDTLVGEVLTTGLEAGDVGLELLDEEQMLGERASLTSRNFIRPVARAGRPIRRSCRPMDISLGCSAPSS